MKTYRRKLAAIIVSISILSSITHVMAIEPSTSKSNTLYELVANLGIEINNETTIEETNNLGTALSKCSNSILSNSSEAPDAYQSAKALVIKTPKADGTINESTIYAADTNNSGNIGFVDFELDIPTNANRSAPTPTLSGNITNYGNLQLPTHDYYFLIGCSYSSKLISGKYALRPIAMWSLLRKESNNAIQVRNTNFYMIMTGYLVNSSGSLVNGYDPAALDMPCITRTPPTLGIQDYISLSNYWTGSGFANSDYLWITTGWHGMSIVFEVYFDTYEAALIEHKVY